MLAALEICSRTDIAGPLAALPPIDTEPIGARANNNGTHIVSPNKAATPSGAL